MKTYINKTEKGATRIETKKGYDGITTFISEVTYEGIFEVSRGSGKTIKHGKMRATQGNLKKCHEYALANLDKAERPNISGIIVE